MENKVTKAELSCIDPRCTPYEREGLKIRRLGGFAGGSMKRHMPSLLRRYGIEELNIRMHDDCGAIKLVGAALKDPNRLDSAMYAAMVKPFAKRISDPHESLPQLDEIAKGISREIAVRWKNDSYLKAIKCTKMHTKGEVTGEKVLLLTTPTTGKLNSIVSSIGLNPSNTYIATLFPGSFEEMAIDPQIAVKYLGIKRIVLYTEEDPYDVVKRFSKAALRGEIKIHGANMTLLR
ncbi:MAG: hypothetical protein ACREBH_00810 [Candidatus Micrarchaeaceae archaeon]